MRARFFVSFLALFWGLTPLLFASVVESPLYNAVTTGGAGSGKMTIGVDYSSVYDRQLDSGGSAGTSAKSGRITAGSQVHAKAVYAVNQYLNVYAKLGLADWEEKVLLNNGGKLNIDYERAFSWGVGSTGGIRFWEDWQLFYDLQFLATNNADVSRITIASKANSTNQGNVDVSEFHFALGVGREFHTYYDWASVIFPYVGFVISTFSIDHNGVTFSTGTFSDELDQDKILGIFGGIRFANESNWSLRVEGRVGDESSVSVSLDYRF